MSNFLPHAWMNRSTITRSWLLTEAAEYNLSPLVTYMVYRWLNNSLLRLFVRLVLGLFRSLGGKRFTNRQRLWTKVAAMLAQAVISNLLIWILLQGPIHLPAGMDPFAALEAIKQSLMGMLSRMDVKMDGQLVSSNVTWLLEVYTTGHVKDGHILRGRTTDHLAYSALCNV